MASSYRESSEDVLMETQTDGDDTFQVGGWLSPAAPCYVDRQADNELLAATRAGEFCFLLTSHHMGKSSLMARTAHRLRSGDGVHEARSTALIDLSDLASHNKPERWYFDLLGKLREQFSLDIDLESWWNKTRQLSLDQQLLKFFGDVLLQQVEGRIVIFVDELERSLSKPFSDNLFAAARACYDARSEHPVFQRLGFVFAGVANPSDLVKDPAQSPLNAGRMIGLEDFTVDQAAPLMRGLAVDDQTKKELLQQIIFWTRGQPYLTQKLCQLIRDSKIQNAGEEIDELIFETLLKPNVRKTDEPHFQFMHHWMAGKHEPSLPRRRRRPALLAYRKIKSGRELHVEETTSAVCDDLKLWGIALPDDDGLFFVRNPIYDQVFDSKWVKRHLPASRPTVVATVCLITLILWLSVYIEWIYPRQLIDTLRTAATDTLQINELQQTYKELRRIPFYESLADQEWGSFAQRRAEQAILGDSDGDDPTYYKLALQARKQIKQWSIEAERDQWEGTSKELLAQFYDQRAVRGRGGALLDREAGILWAIAASDTLESEDRRKALLDYTGGLGALQRTFRVQFDVLETKWTAEEQPVLVGKLGNGVYVNDTAKDRLDVLITPGDVRLLAGGPDGRRTVSLSGTNYVRLWDTWTPDPPKALITPRGTVTSLGMSADGRRILTVLNDRYAQLWDAETGNLEQALILSEEPLAKVILGPSGERLLTVSNNGMLKLWDTKSKAEKWNLDTRLPKTPTTMIEAVFSPDGQRILCSFVEPPLVRSLDVESGAETQTLNLLNPTYSPDGSHLVGVPPGPTQNLNERAQASRASSEFMVIDLTDRNSPFPEKSISVQPQSPAQTVDPGSFATGRLLPVRLLLGPTASLVVVDFGAEAQVIDVNTGSLLIWTTPNASNGSTFPLPISFSPNGQLVALGTSSNTVQLWGTAMASELARPAEEPPVPASPDGTLSMSVWEKKLGLKIRSDGTIGPLGD